MCKERVKLEDWNTVTKSNEDRNIKKGTLYNTVTHIGTQRLKHKDINANRHEEKCTGI